MNHRQWKKKFKKVHGRAPYPWEDERVKSKLTRFELEQMCETVSNIPKILAEVFADVAEEEGFKELARQIYWGFYTEILGCSSADNFNLNAFDTTKIELKLIAKAPSIGFRVNPSFAKTPAATGIPKTL